MAGSSAAVTQQDAEWDLCKLVKALNMVLGAAGLALKGKASRPSAGGKGPRPQTTTYKLDGGRVAAIPRLRRGADASENAHARARLDACALPLYGHLVREEGPELQLEYMDEAESE